MDKPKQHQNRIEQEVLLNHWLGMKPLKGQLPIKMRLGTQISNVAAISCPCCQEQLSDELLRGVIRKEKSPEGYDKLHVSIISKCQNDDCLEMTSAYMSVAEFAKNTCLIEVQIDGREPTAHFRAPKPESHKGS